MHAVSGLGCSGAAGLLATSLLSELKAGKRRISAAFERRESDRVLTASSAEPRRDMANLTKGRFLVRTSEQNAGFAPPADEANSTNWHWLR
jgi:hypothetical protein